MSQYSDVEGQSWFSKRSDREPLISLSQSYTSISVDVDALALVL
jgi:hypothetical protein